MISQPRTVWSVFCHHYLAIYRLGRIRAGHAHTRASLAQGDDPRRGPRRTAAAAGPALTDPGAREACAPRRHARLRRDRCLLRRGGTIRANCRKITSECVVTAHPGVVTTHSPRQEEPATAAEPDVQPDISTVTGRNLTEREPQPRNCGRAGQRAARANGLGASSADVELAIPDAIQKTGPFVLVVYEYAALRVAGHPHQYPGAPGGPRRHGHLHRPRLAVGAA
jgi:hypothetical protein